MKQGCRALPPPGAMCPKTDPVRQLSVPVPPAAMLTVGSEVMTPLGTCFLMMQRYSKHSPKSVPRHSHLHSQLPCYTQDRAAGGPQPGGLALTLSSSPNSPPLRTSVSLSVYWECGVTPQRSDFMWPLLGHNHFMWDAP